MLSNYLKIAFRNLIRNRTYAFINVIGLAVGIAACLLLFLTVRFELSFDTFHSKKDSIYRLLTEMHPGGATIYTAGVPLPIPQGLRLDFPQLKNVAAIFERSGEVAALDASGHAAKKFNEQKGVFFVEPQFFQMFDFGVLAGDPETALAMPNNAFLTQATAERYFGDWKSAIGKSIKFRNSDTYTITGILKDIPANSDFPLHTVVSYKSLKGVDMSDWVGTFGYGYCFVQLPPGLSPTEFDGMLARFARAHKPPAYADQGMIVEPLRDMHFNADVGNYSGRAFSKELIAGIGLIGLFLIVIACVNFVNLATAQVVNRSKEVGVRKVLGSGLGQLRLQFLGETAMITFVAILVALVLAELALPYLNELLNIRLSLNLFNSPEIAGFLLITWLLVSVLSGMYPALVLSGFAPIVALKGGSIKASGGISFRRGLVILQFVISQTLIICTLAVVTQLNFLRNAPLGFDKGETLLVPIPNDTQSQAKIERFRSELLRQSGIADVSFSAFSPSDEDHWMSDLKFDHSDKKTDFNATLKWADAEYFKLYGIPFVAGRPYSPLDSVREVVVNEMFLRKLGIRNPEAALGKTVNLWGGSIVAPIVGVVGDFHDRSLRQPINPTILGPMATSYQLANIRIRATDVKSTMSSIEKLWNATYPDYVYESQFLDEKIESFYRQEKQLSELYLVFAGIAIFISCLGLFGLVSFMTQQKTKEIGIRKVLGASVANIVYLFSKEFILLITIAFLIASPLAYLLMREWLADFAYHISMGVELFLIALTGSILVAWITAAYRAFGAALANPIKALRYE